MTSYPPSATTALSETRRPGIAGGFARPVGSVTKRTAAPRRSGSGGSRPRGRAPPRDALRREKPDSRTCASCRGRRGFLPDPSSPLPSTDAAFHRESHQGGDARAGRGSPPRPQLRRHRAGTRTRLPPLPSHRPVDGDERQSVSFLGQALWRSSPLSVARRFATRSDPSAAASTNRSCSASSAKAPASPPRCSSPWVRLLSPPARGGPPFPTFRETRPQSRCLIHCRGV